MKLGVMMALLIIMVVLALSLKSRNPKISSLVSVAICILLLCFCVSRIRLVLEGLNKITDKVHVDWSYLTLLLKLIGIAYICEFAASISKDAGYQAVASQIELFGKLTMLVVSLPVLYQVVETVLEVL